MDYSKMNMEEVIKNIKIDLDAFENAKVRCAIIGRSGTGKSSLINAIMGSEVAAVGEVETTIEVKTFESKGIIFGDLPGCSTERFPRSTYISDMKIKDYDCVLIVTSDRFYEDDFFLMKEIEKLNRPIFAIRSKIDQSVMAGERRGVNEKTTLLDIHTNLKESIGQTKVKGIYLVSSWEPAKYDLTMMLTDIKANLTDIKKKRFIADIAITSVSILNEKRIIAESLVSKYSTVAAANGLNPIPGLDIGVDLSIMYKMYQSIKDIYGINESQVDFYKDIIGEAKSKLFVSKAMQLAAKYGSKEAVMILLKRFSISMAGKTFSKWIPFVGMAVSAGIGFKMTSSVGQDMVGECEALAKEILESVKRI